LSGQGGVIVRTEPCTKLLLW